ncbi:outer membrane lipoprotein carrier protein LolA [Alteromonas gilva]|uniref:Outer membrane lipoprotein carrier protein LolA n=1 Tax=Alteromonas gilva TaxID=2987522 RepID=A0ABT5KXU2_9ALTE|nr:outer membrane lipoprotein carrier protein LolA [Alteromonas gilva]MDC8829453.1 outer membrane lipoprotein carrier protein LolA [Alteromonas gilva]
MTSVWQWVIFCVALCALAPRDVQASTTQTKEASLLAGIFPSGCHFSGRFSQQKSIPGVPHPLTSSGDFYYSCDLGLVWHTETPFNEAILYVNSSNNFKADAEGTLAPLSGTTRYIMSNIFVRLLKGDTSYFVDEFAITSAEQNAAVQLRPESDYIRKGLDTITIKKAVNEVSGTSLDINVIDASGQHTDVTISDVTQHNIDGKKAAYEQCEALYLKTADWCQVLRSPSRY